MREVRIPVGEPLRSSELFKTLTRLHASGRFIIAHSQITPHPDGGIVVCLCLEEAPFPRLGIGLGFDSDRKSRYFAEMTWEQDVIEQIEALSILGVYGERDQHVKLSLVASRLFKTYLGWKTSFHFHAHERDNFDEDGVVLETARLRFYDFNVGAQYNLWTWGTLSTSWIFQQTEQKVMRPWENYHSAFLSGFSLKAAFDTKDRDPFPRSGVAVDVNYESYLTLLGSEESFNRLQLNAELVTPILHRLVGRAVVKNWVSDRTTPSTHLFSLGGITDFPAFRPDRFLF